MNNERAKKQTKQQKNGGFNMFKTIKKQLKNEKGLTLIELLAVIVILAIIAAIAIPAIGNIITNSKYNAIKSDGINVINAAQLYYLDNPQESDSNPVTVYELQGKTTAGGTVDNAVYLENPGTINEEATVSVDSPHKLTGTAKLNSYIITFENASIEVINKDSKKGSEIKANSAIGQ